MKEQKKDQALTGSVSFKWLPKKYSTCPYCGAMPNSYSINTLIKWNESIRYECGLSVYNQTSNSFNESGKCKHSKEWKKLQKKRLEQVEKLEKSINEIITDKKIHKELKEEIVILRDNINRWWYD